MWKMSRNGRHAVYMAPTHLISLYSLTHSFSQTNNKQTISRGKIYELQMEKEIEASWLALESSYNGQQMIHLIIWTCPGTWRWMNIREREWICKQSPQNRSRGSLCLTIMKLLIQCFVSHLHNVICLFQSCNMARFVFVPRCHHNAQLASIFPRRRETWLQHQLLQSLFCFQMTSSKLAKHEHSN